jgi:hypothetical protein
MAQTFQIAVAFHFRRVPEHWERATGRIVGLESPFGEDFGLEVKFRNGRKRRITYSAGDVPYELREQCRTSFAESEDPEDTVARVCSEFHPEVIVPRHHDSVLFFTEELGLPADPWHLRDTFLRVRHDQEHLLEFLNSWGRWSESHYVAVQEFFQFQNVVRRALVSPPEEWFGQYGDELDQCLDERKQVFPYFAVKTHDCEVAIRMTVTIDLLRNVKFSVCARPDCGQPFPMLSLHKRKYCCQYCAHLESVRRCRQVKRRGKRR